MSIDPRSEGTALVVAVVAAALSVVVGVVEATGAAVGCGSDGMSTGGAMSGDAGGAATARDALVSSFRATTKVAAAANAKTKSFFHFEGRGTPAGTISSSASSGDVAAFSAESDDAGTIIALIDDGGASGTRALAG